MNVTLRYGMVVLTITGLLFVLSGCSHTVDMRPQVRDAQRDWELSRPIGIYHGPEFIGYRQSADVYGDLRQSDFPVGPASDRLFREAYPKIFRSFQYITDVAERGAAGKKVDAVLEPDIAAFNFPLQSMKGPYWAEVVYRFTLFSTDRKIIYSWEVKGWGEAGDGSVPDGAGLVAKSAEAALENAANRFMSSFRNMPELRRWALGINPEGATAPKHMQRVRTVAESDESKKECIYEGVVTVRAELLRIEGETDGPGDASKTPHAYGMRVIVTNDGMNRLLVDPLAARFITADNQEVDPVPGVYVAALLSPRYGPIGPMEQGVGRESNPPMIFSLAEKAADIAERRELQAQLNKWRFRGLREQVLGRKASTEGWLFFVLPSAGPLRGDLRIPIVELETATRYIVDLPLQESPSGAGRAQ